MSIKFVNPNQNFSEPEFEYLPELIFEHVSVERKIEKKCRKALKKELVSIRQKWMGAFYAKEIEEKKALDLEVRWIDAQIGYGVFTRQKIKKGAFIGEYTGIVRKKRFWERKQDHDYSFEYLIGEEEKSLYYIDAKASGNITRFINHSDLPNLEPAAVIYREKIHIILFALKEIQPDMELSYDYGTDYWAKRSFKKVQS